MPEQETPELVVLPHFKPEEVEALEKEHARREAAMKVRPSLDPDEERIRDAIQRGQFWLDQIVHLQDADILDEDSLAHAREELAHCLFIQGRIDEALSLSKDPERRAYFESTRAAILKDDDKSCECKTPEHVIGKFPSAKHQGRLMPVRVCPECKAVNIG